MSHTVQNGTQSPLQSQHYQWDSVGNLTERRDATLGTTETYQYDNLDRLKTSTLALTQSDILSGAIATGHQYDAIGNLKAKGASITGYQYGQETNGALSKPHAVNKVSVSGIQKTYRYDANGNLEQSGTRQIDWASYNKPLQITDGAQHSTFAYGPDRARYRHVRSDSEGITTTTYIGQAYERIERSGKDTLHRYNLHVGNQVIAVHDITTKEGDDNTKLAFQTRYLHRDHLGSVTLITDNNGQIIERLNYDPWGQRRDLETLASLASTAASAFASSNTDGDESKDNTLTTAGAGIDLSQSLIATVFQPKWHTFHRGYTGHEMLDHLNLIHMNGRIYDPEIGRFLSADPFVQFPESTQGFNRYTYVGNNPLSYTDPSGFFSWRKALKGIAIAVVSIYTGGLAAATWGGLAGAAVGGAVGGYLSTGTLNGALFGAVAGMVAYGIGSGFDSLAKSQEGSLTTGQFIGKGLAHGASQGILSRAGGGRFGDGFLGGFASSITSPITDGMYKGDHSAGAVAARVTAAAVIGGTLARIGGGNFANGAVTAAFVRAFNEDMHNGDPMFQEEEYEDIGQSSTTLSVKLGKNSPFSLRSSYDPDEGFSASGGLSKKLGSLSASVRVNTATGEFSDDFYLPLLNEGVASFGPYVNGLLSGNTDWAIGLRAQACVAVVCLSQSQGIRPRIIYNNIDRALTPSFYRSENSIYMNARVLEELFGK